MCPLMRRVRLSFLPGLEIEFTDRDVALRQVEDWARESTRWPIVVFGPEGGLLTWILSLLIGMWR